MPITTRMLITIIIQSAANDEIAQPHYRNKSYTALVKQLTLGSFDLNLIFKFFDTFIQLFTCFDISWSSRFVGYTSKSC